MADLWPTDDAREPTGYEDYSDEMLVWLHERSVRLYHTDGEAFSPFYARRMWLEIERRGYRR